MGCFSSNCALSGLPINATDKVRFLLLAEVVDKRMVVSPTDQYVPYTFPLRARYDDYGSVEEVEVSKAANLWMEVLRPRLVQLGTGDNSYHDVPVHPNMSFYEMLRALQEGRLFVHGRGGIQGPVAPTEGVPGLESVQNILGKAKALNRFLVDELEYGTVRLRSLEGDPGKALKAIRPLFKRYATMIRAGSGSYPTKHELLISIAPNKAGKHPMPFRPRERRQLQMAMIREDVWKRVLALGFPLRFEDREGTLKHAKEMATKLWRTTLEDQDSFTATLEGSYFDVVYEAIYCSHAYGTRGLRSSWETALKHFQNKLWSTADRNHYLNSVAELATVMAIAHPLRYWWRPSYPCGPQYGEFKLLGDYHEAMLKLCRRRR